MKTVPLKTGMPHCSISQVTRQSHHQPMRSLAQLAILSLGPAHRLASSSHLSGTHGLWSSPMNTKAWAYHRVRPRLHISASPQRTPARPLWNDSPRDVWEGAHHIYVSFPGHRHSHLPGTPRPQRVPGWTLVSTAGSSSHPLGGFPAPSP